MAVVALTGHQYSATLKPNNKTLAKLREIHGDSEDAFREALGYGFDALTQSEARYLANFKPANKVRTRILEERDSRRNEAGAGAGRDGEVGFSLAPRSLASVADTVLADKMTKPEFREALLKEARSRLEKMRQDGNDR